MYNHQKIRKQYLKNILQNDILFDNIIQLNNISFCNTIDENIKQIIPHDVLKRKENELQGLFPILSKHNDTEYVYHNTKRIFYISILPFYEYNWFKKIIGIAENIPISITISSAKKELFWFSSFVCK
jgi:hypothetical protein